jgi:hypothetical protein
MITTHEITYGLHDRTYGSSSGHPILRRLENVSRRSSCICYSRPISYPYIISQRGFAYQTWSFDNVFRGGTMANAAFNIITPRYLFYPPSPRSPLTAPSGVPVLGVAGSEHTAKKKKNQSDASYHDLLKICCDRPGHDAKRPHDAR